MALLDYKITRLSHEGRHVTATVRISRGAVTTEQEEIDRVLTDVTRYRRIATVRERTFEYDVQRDMTREEFLTKSQAFLRKKLLDWAAANGHTVVNEQQYITNFEPMLNEQEYAPS